MALLKAYDAAKGAQIVHPRSGDDRHLCHPTITETTAASTSSAKIHAIVSRVMPPPRLWLPVL